MSSFRSPAGAEELWNAVRQNDVRRLRDALEQNGSSAAIATSHGWTVVHEACRAGSLACLNELVSTGLVSTTGVTTSNICLGNDVWPRGYTALCAASEGGHVDVVQYLVEECCVNPCETHTAGTGALFVACAKGHMDVASYFVEECPEVDPFEKTAEGITLLLEAITSGVPDLVRFLLDRLCFDPNEESACGFRPVHAAASRGHLDVLKVLIEAGADPNARKHNGFTALHVAAENGHYNVISFLIEDLSVDRSLRTASGDTAAVLADRLGFMRIALYLSDEQSPRRAPQPAVIPLYWEEMPMR